MTLRYNKEDYHKLRDDFYKNPERNPISGYTIAINGNTYNKLVVEFGDPYDKKLKTFHQFEQLPLELQEDIYGRNVDTLKHSIILSKTSNKATKNRLCGLEITSQEYIKYLHKVMPDKTYAFPYPTSLLESIFNVTKFILYKYPRQDTETTYKYSADCIKHKNNIVTVFNVSGSYMLSNILPSEYDLLTSYFIYKRRQSCQHLQNYAKNQILKLLTQKHKDVQNNYVGLLSWYFYLRANLSQFPYELPFNKYYDYIIAIDKKGNIIDIIDDTEQLLIQLQSYCNDFYEALLEQLHKL